MRLDGPRAGLLFGIFTLSSAPPEPTRILKQPEYRVVQRGMSALFECKVKHDPSLIPTMTWRKDNGELPDDERYASLTFVLDTVCGKKWRKASH